MRWIKCSDRMPKKEETVLVWHGDYCYREILEWTGTHWSPRYDERDITHWMPLPDRPKEDE